MNKIENNKEQKNNPPHRFVFRKLTKKDMEKGAKEFKKNFLHIFKKLSKEE